MVWKITFNTLGDLPCMLLFFIAHVRNCVMGATLMNIFGCKYFSMSTNYV